MINKKEIKAYTHSQGYRLGKGCDAALIEVLKKAIDRGIFYTRPQKTIKPENIYRFLAVKKDVV